MTWWLRSEHNEHGTRFELAWRVYEAISGHLYAWGKCQTSTRGARGERKTNTGHALGQHEHIECNNSLSGGNFESLCAAAATTAATVAAAAVTIGTVSMAAAAAARSEAQTDTEAVSRLLSLSRQA